MKHNPLIISIPHPCTEDWAAMTPDGQGRFCTHCQTRVVDFSNWSDEQLYRFFAEHKGDTCGMFTEVQLNRTIQIPFQPKSKLYRIAVALGLTIMVAGAGSVEARPRPPLVQNSVLGIIDSNKMSQTTDSFGTIYGCIKDDKNELIVNASIAVTRNDTLVGGAISDFDGNYQIANLKDGIYKLTVSYTGLDTQRLTDIQVVKGAESEVNIV